MRSNRAEEALAFREQHESTKTFARLARTDWTKSASEKSEGYFGNIWWRSHFIARAGDFHAGHRHKFDHVTLVVSGALRCETPGHAPKDFGAGDAIVIAKDQWHKLTALAPSTIYFCVFAMRDIDGNVADVYSGDASPYDHAPFTREEVEAVLSASTQVCSGCAACSGKGKQ